MKDHARRRARHLAIESLYETETSGHDALAALEHRIEMLRTEDPGRLRKGADTYSREMVAGVLTTQDEADAMIADAAPRYELDTMAIVDRNILRLAIWELLSDTSAPVAAVVNEAVELAHRYGGDTSPGFVNGVLRNISTRIVARRPVGTVSTNQPSNNSPGE